MKKSTMLLILVVLFLVPVVSAQDITMSVDQSTYYFLVGQNAVVPLTYNNTYGKQLDGQLKYTITQEVKQGGFYYSSTNTQSSAFYAEEGNHLVNLNFGTSESPALLKVTLTFSYEYNQEQRAVTLDQISIYFVSNESQMNNQPGKMEKSSEKVADSPPPQQPSQQNPQQQLQNNQMSQDSNALKQQLEKQLREQQQLKDEFQRNLFNNSEFQNLHQQLINQGYNLTSSSVNPTDNNSGRFSLEYKNEQGETATLSGEMNNGELENVQKLTAEDKQQMLQQLYQNESFQRYLEQLEQEGFNQTNVEFSQEDNKTNARINFRDGQNQTAAINAEFVNGVLKDVELEKEEIQQAFSWILVLSFIIIIVSCIGVLILYFKIIKRASKSNISGDLNKQEPFDYLSEAKKLLDEAKKLFEDTHYKDAYGKAAQSLRLFLSYYYGLNKEMTNDEIINYLKCKNTSYQQIKDCFDLCSLVEFAKYQANKKDFDEIIHTTGKTITSLASS